MIEILFSCVFPFRVKQHLPFSLPLLPKQEAGDRYDCLSLTLRQEGSFVKFYIGLIRIFNAKNKAIQDKIRL